MRLEGKKTSGSVRLQGEGRRRQRENQVEKKVTKEEEIVLDQGTRMGSRVHESFGEYEKRREVGLEEK